MDMWPPFDVAPLRKACGPYRRDQRVEGKSRGPDSIGCKSGQTHRRDISGGSSLPYGSVVAAMIASATGKRICSRATAFSDASLRDGDERARHLLRNALHSAGAYADFAGNFDDAFARPQLLLDGLFNLFAYIWLGAQH